MKLGLKRAETDYGVFYTHIRQDIILLAIHVNDCVLTGSNLALLTEFKQKISTIYKLTDMGPISWLLGIKVTRDRKSRTLSLSQTSYIFIIRHFNFDDLKPISTPLDLTMQFSRNQCPQMIAKIACMKNIPYRESIGSLMYAAISTHPDIAFTVSTLAQFQDNPGQVHWDAVKQVFHYINDTKGLALTYGGEGKTRGLQGFSDANGASQEHCHVITGFTFLVDGGAVSWSSKKQELVTLSTTEAGYVTSSHVSCETMWLCKLIGELFCPLKKPIPLYCDNQSAIAQSLVSFVNFYQQFIPGFSHHARALFDLTMKDVRFIWGLPQEDSFMKLKELITSAPVLVLLNDDLPFRLEANSSSIATGVVLSQRQVDNNVWHPIIFLSKVLNPVEQNYKIYNTEMLAII
jgi:hypothetical protein